MESQLEFKVGDIIVMIGCRAKRMVLGTLNGKYGKYYDISQPLGDDSVESAIRAFAYDVASVSDRGVEKIYVKVGHWNPELLEYTDE